MKSMMIGMVVLLGMTGISQTNDLVSCVRSSVSSVVSSLPQGLWGEPSQIREFGTNPANLPGYRELVGIVSNNQDFVCTNFNNCATNEISRMMLLSAWWGGDDSLYISGLSHCLDLVVSGVLTRDDLAWYRFGHRNESRCCILSLRYDEPGVSNLVIRLCNYTGEIEACRRILSGESRISVTNYLWQISH